MIDAIAALTLASARSGRPGDPVKREERAKLATLLGAAHTVRGCFDEGSLDAPAARESVRTLHGPDEFEAAYERGRALCQDDAVALAVGGEPRQGRVTRDPGPERHSDCRPAVVSVAGSSSADGLPWSW